MKLYLLDANENIIAMPPTKDLLSLIQDLKLKDTDTIEGALVVSKRYTSIMDNVRYIAVSDRDNDHAFYLYRKTMAEVQDRELIFDGKESFWDDLAGSYIKDKRPGAMLAPDLVKLILAGTRWNVDFVDSGFTETLNTNFYYQSRSDALSNVMSAMTIDIVPMINIEGNTITRRYVNLYLQAGGDNGRRFVYGKNALSVVKKTDDSQVFTALVGRGKSIEQTSTDTETGETTTYNTPKINFADVEWSKAAGDPVDKPKGQEYVEWPESTKLYGYSNGNPRIGIVDFDNDDDPAQLLKDTWAQLQNTGVPSVQFSATVGDVGYLNKGETVTIVNYVKGITYKTRVTELKWNRLAEAKSQLTIGDKLVQNANERMASIAMQQSSTAIQAATQTIQKQVANLVTVTNSLGVNVSWSKDGALPLEPKEGDIVYIRNDDGTITMKSYKDGQWVIIIDDTTGQQIQKKVDAKLVQLNADMSAADENLKSAKQDVADLQVKLKANDDAQAQLKNDLSENSTILEKAQADIVTNTQALSDLDTKLKANDDAQAKLQDDLAANTKVQDQLKIDLSDNTELINQVKTDTANSLEKVHEDLTKAQSNAAQAVIDADQAVANAKSAVEASGLASTTANSANDAALAANQLATEVSNNFATVQSQAATASSDAANAISTANKAQGDATSALGNSNTAISAANKAQGDATSALGNSNTAIGNAQDALNKINSMSIGGTNLIMGSYDSSWGFANNKSTIEKVTTDSGEVALHVISTNNFTGFYTVFNFPSGNYTLSVDVKGTGEVRQLGWEGISDARMTPTSDWQRVSRTGSLDGKSHAFVFYGTMDVYVRLLKVEKGNQATDWSPAPEDVQIQITANSKEIALAAKQSVVDTLAKQVTDNTSQLKLTATAASLEVTSKKVDTLSQTVTDQGAKLDLTATSAQLKVTENKVDALNKTVSDNSAQLKLTATSAALETQSKRVDTISGQVDTNTAGITAANGEIELKASNSRVDTLSNTIKQQGIDLKAAQGQLALKITQDDLTKGLDGYATQTWAQNQITATATELNSTMTTVQQQVTDSSVGINLLRNARTLDGWKAWRGSAGGKGFNIEDKLVDSGQYRMAHIFNNVDGQNSDGPYWPGEKLSLTAGQVYTISIWSHSLGTSEQPVSWTLWLNWDKDNTYQGVNITNTTAPDWTHYSATFTATVGGQVNNVRIVPKFGTGSAANVGGAVYLLKPKLERGSRATDFSVNPADNATVTAFSQLSQTVEGLTGTFATKNDLAATTTNLKLTSDGLNLITAVTGTNGENVTQVIADVKNIKTTMTGANGYSTRLQTLEGFQQTATETLNGVATSSQVTQLANQLTSTVGNLGQQNLIYNSRFSNALEGWTNYGNYYYTSYPWAGVEAGGAAINNADDSSTVYKFLTSKRVDIGPVQTYSASVVMVPLQVGVGVGLEICYYADATGARIEQGNVGYKDVWIKASKNAPQTLKIENFAVPAGAKYVGIQLLTHGPAHSFWQHPMLVAASTVGPYQPDTVGYSQITQLQGLIDQRVMVDGKIAAALSLSADGGGTVTIRGASLYVTADSHFDNASIQSAAIANLDAAKITSGSISADRLATTKLNADNITSGSISADRLATTKLNASNITSGSINAGLITTGVLSADMILGGTFDASKMTVKNINAGSITSGSIASALLASTQINADNITSGSIAAARIATTALSATNITSGTLDVGKLTVKNLSADMIASGTIDASKITVKNLSASNIIGGELDAVLVNVKNLNASNIITGTLNAGLLNVIGLNASAISAGTINGTHLAINLDSGQVVFQSGQIHSTTDNIDINIDKGYMSVADNTSRVLLKGGQLQFVQPQLFDLQTTPYLSISNDGVGSNWAGATIIGRDSIMLANSANVGGILTWQLGQNNFSGLISGKNANGTWEPTILGGADRGVVIVGGAVGWGPAGNSPYIRVGSSIDGTSAGNRIYVNAEYFYVPSIYKHTMSGSANVIVASDGALVRTSSATKYKSNIERFRNTDMGEALLNLPQAHWYNKQDMQRYVDDPQHYSMPELDYGMIAEDLAAAGLEDLVVRGDDGQLEDIRYDRMTPALLPLLAKMKQEIEELKSAAKSA